MSTFVPETGIAAKVEITHTESAGYRLSVRRVIGWLTFAVQGDDGETQFFTQATVAADPEGATAVHTIVRLYSVAEYENLCARAETYNRNDMRKIKNLSAASKKLRDYIGTYL